MFKFKRSQKALKKDHQPTVAIGSILGEAFLSASCQDIKHKAYK